MHDARILLGLHRDSVVVELRYVTSLCRFP